MSGRDFWGSARGSLSSRSVSELSSGYASSQPTPSQFILSTHISPNHLPSLSLPPTPQVIPVLLPAPPPRPSPSSPAVKEDTAPAEVPLPPPALQEPTVPPPARPVSPHVSSVLMDSTAPTVAPSHLPSVPSIIIAPREPTIISPLLVPLAPTARRRGCISLLNAHIVPQATIAPALLLGAPPVPQEHISHFLAHRLRVLVCLVLRDTYVQVLV